VPSTPVTLTVTALGAAVGAANGLDAIAGNSERNASGDITLTNRMGAFPGAAMSVAMGSARRDRAQLRETQQRMYDVDVPAGSTALVARVRGVTAAADLDLYLFDCSGKECVASRADGDMLGDESVMVQNPAAGKWKVVVDAFNTDSLGAWFEYEDVVLNPAYGFVAVTDQPKDRDAGATWSARANAWLTGAIPAGRSPYAGVLLQAQPKGLDSFILGLFELRGALERASGSAMR
jgi:hypothetical protein